MKDLDFDELDRAVNSIMSSTKPPARDESNESEQKPSLDQTPSRVSPPLQSDVNSPTVSDMPMPMSVPQSGGPTEKPEPSVTSMTVPERKTPPAAVRRGRFMDMVRPGAVQPSEPTSRVSRQGVAVEPTGPLMTDIIPTTTTPPVAKKAPSVASAPSASTSPTTSATTETEWPDPIDMLQDDDRPRSSKGSETGEAAPLVSPFLSGTKVEKRPLGSGSSQPPKSDVDAVEAAPSEEADQDDIRAQLAPAPPEVTTAPLPAELASDVMALESDANTMAMPADEVKTEVARQVAEQKAPLAPEAPESPVPEDGAKPSKEETAPITPTPIKASPTSEPESVTPKGPISIPQQYREEPSTGDKGNGAIYDTDTYHHQPLAHPKKKKSGWLWVIWIILILAVGAAGGAAMYWFGVF